MTAIFGNILDQALELNLQRQAINAKNRHHLAPHQWMQEFGTVQIKLGRGVGHTTAIRKKATDGDLVIVGSTFSEMTMTENAGRKPTVMAKPELGSNKIRGKSFDRVWVDDASLRSEEDIKNVYVIALMHRANQIILVG